MQSQTLSNFGISVCSMMLGLLVAACSETTEANSNLRASLPPQIANESIEIDGSSTVYPITAAVAEEFRQTNADATITVAFSGTGGGFEKFCAGNTDINNASRPITTAELAACRSAGVRFIELPIAFDALTVVVNPQNTWAESLTVAELKRIWEPSAQGQVQSWKQIRPDFPDQPLQLFGAGTDSGTYDYFAEAIVGQSNTRSDYTGSEDDDLLVQGVSQSANAIGFFGLSYYERNQDRLKAVAIDDGNGAVLPTRTAVEDASYQPLSRPLFIYVNVQSAQYNDQVRAFVDFYLQHGARMAESVGYVPLPQEAYEVGHVHLYKGEVGTAYDGKAEPYLTIREVLLREQKL